MPKPVLGTLHALMSRGKGDSRESLPGESGRLRSLMAVVGSCLEVTSLTVGEMGADALKDGGSIPCDTHRNFENRNHIERTRKLESGVAFDIANACRQPTT